MSDPPPDTVVDPTVDTARAALQRHGLRATTQRLVVLGAMVGRHDDTTAQALHERLRGEHPSLGLATVYRTLGALVEAGVLDAMQHGHGTCYRLCAPGHHHHLTCVKCHRVVEVRECTVGAWAEEVGRSNGFSEVRHTVELTGLCATCAAA